MTSPFGIKKIAVYQYKKNMTCEHVMWQDSSGSRVIVRYVNGENITLKAKIVGGVIKEVPFAPQAPARTLYGLIKHFEMYG